MITLIRMIRLWQLRTKWRLALYQFLDKQLTEVIKDPGAVEKKLMPYLAELIHTTGQNNAAKQ